MKLNIFTKSMIGMGLVCSALPALAMEAWNNQQGGNKYQVIFDGKIYENAWWVSSTNCPGAYSALFDHGLASKSDQRFASIRSTGNLTFSTAF